MGSEDGKGLCQRTHKDMKMGDCRFYLKSWLGVWGMLKTLLKAFY